jgi:hypothetical protein
VTSHPTQTNRADHTAPERGPLEVRVEPDGTGSASFGWAHVLEALRSGFEPQVRSAVRGDIEIIGVRFVDADGRPVHGPVPAGVALVGFTTRGSRQPRP